ncbi:unnamed protein product [Pylaiella littoralis]
MERDELLPSPSNTYGSGGSNDATGRRGTIPSSQGIYSTPPSASNAWISRGRAAMGRTQSFTVPLVMPWASSASSTMPRTKSSVGLFSRRQSNEEVIWSAEDVATADVATAISQDLVGKAERWKLLAWEPLGSHGASQAPETRPLLGRYVDKHEVASIYVQDALAGRDCSACIHTEESFRALKLYRSKAWVQLLNICTIIHLILPMVEIQRCLPCLGVQQLPPYLDNNALFVGWRPTSLGSMWIESVMCILYAYHLLQQGLSRLGDIPAGEKEEEENGDQEDQSRPQAEVYSLLALPPWQVARTIMVAFISVSLAGNIFSHYVFGVTWNSWRQMILPFLFISRRTYLKHFVASIIRLIPKMLPVVFLISFITFFYGFLGYIVYRDEPHSSSLLSDLQLFDSPASSALTFLRIFTARSFMLDVEKIYSGRDGVQVMTVSYGVIMFIFLLALVPAVATHNFSAESKKSYYWVKGQRKLALSRAFMLLKQPDGTLAREDYLQLMACLRPDCDRDHTSALFSAANKVEKNQSNSLPTEDDRRNRLSKAGFFMVCALGTADFSRTQNKRMKALRSRRSRRKWARVRRRLDAALLWSRAGSTFPLSQQVLDVALLVQGYQIIKAGDDPEVRPGWVYPLGAALIAYFCIQSSLRIIAGGARAYFMEWRNTLEMSLNLIGVAFYGGLWPRGQGWHSFYQILQASRLELLWNYLHLLGPTSSEVATRLELVGPAVVRASLVLFSITYSYAVVAFAMYCSTPLGRESLESFKDDSMVKRFEAVKEVASFETLPKSFASMMYVLMFSNWPMFMDAATVMGNPFVAKVFFYSFKIFGFYFIMPVLLGSTVTAYMNVQVQPMGAGTPAGMRSAYPSTDSLSLSKHRSFNGAGAGDARRRGDTDAKAVRRHSSFGEDRFSGKKGAPVESEIDKAVAAALAEGGEFDGTGTGRVEPILDEYRAGIDYEEGLAEESDEDGEDGSNAVGDGASSRGRHGSYVDGASTEDELDHPVVIASRSRSLSQSFWAQHQASDGGTHASTTMQGTLASLEAELTRLKTENASLRSHMDTREASVRQYVAQMHEEMQASAGDSPSPAGQATTRRAGAGIGVGVGIGAATTAARAGAEPPSTNTSPERRTKASLRTLAAPSTAAHTIWGMKAIFEGANDGGGGETGDGLV